ncbi:UDP-N-acetylmuramate:L-alanyl-gamma-D-glutamyl-meso-diaminopimelate ligase [Idiomarina tyrosinivorans]|uniref:UDP-N-acetylmuramate--L-alanyl-gamma-D-glutamyl-meso-2,6-diaminoheptandioate ligase n=1 Tax=Idiomarina tyrosinivorans TaxID=1445662 RepID=A0A432ZRX2_9GAMM|nr:UDP-N-acetylmuramate:L-alanyl-gamma-D-glutamyl-meso-diaminopimelate ligase [Idiomarina tyrosinivorans]RUO80660.1 UDP-N-acetylmuramate:L-alanyl-gamma-D-glutamyl-meso-diaminopimelate ligase [Idiomarina tyrosinivorans]
MHIHIVGICGTFMGGVAALAQQLGHKVTGSDQHVYPPMSTQLEALGIELQQGFSAENLTPTPDLVVIGNALSRGNPEVEAVLRRRLPYQSGAAWLHDHILTQRWVIAVAGTHGKTTTASMVAWILEYAGLQPGYLIGGVPGNFDTSARLGAEPFFVIEADEYDTAFFDKRSKFVHYQPSTLVINNLEFDHADIFADLAAIQKQFAHLLRIVPDNGQVIIPAATDSIEQVLQQGCWSPVLRFASQEIAADWHILAEDAAASRLCVKQNAIERGRFSWELLGEHNQQNAIAAILAARHAGVDVATACEALAKFVSPKRRLEKRGEVAGVTVFDDFAHHPTAIRTTLSGVQATQRYKRVVAVLEPRSNTMKLGVHGNALEQALQQADAVFVLQPEQIAWSLQQQLPKAHVAHSVAELVQAIVGYAAPGDAIVVMSNGSFDGIHERLLSNLRKDKG